MIGDMRRGHDSLVRGFGGVVSFDGFRADSIFCDEFNGGAEEVVKESPFVPIEIIEERDNVGLIESFISEPLPYMGPVFLFDMGVVIFVIGSAAGKMDGVSSL